MKNSMIKYNDYINKTFYIKLFYLLIVNIIITIVINSEVINNDKIICYITTIALLIGTIILILFINNRFGRKKKLKYSYSFDNNTHSNNLLLNIFLYLILVLIFYIFTMYKYSNNKIIYLIVATLLVGTYIILLKGGNKNKTEFNTFLNMVSFQDILILASVIILLAIYTIKLCNYNIILLNTNVTISKTENGGNTEENEMKAYLEGIYNVFCRHVNDDYNMIDCSIKPILMDEEAYLIDINSYYLVKNRYPIDRIYEDIKLNNYTNNNKYKISHYVNKYVNKSYIITQQMNKYRRRIIKKAYYLIMLTIVILTINLYCTINDMNRLICLSEGSPNEDSK